MYASESIGPPGGVSEVGQGKLTYATEIERARLPLAYRNMVPSGNLRPRTQIPVAMAGNQRASEVDVGVGTMFGKAVRGVLAFLGASEPTRKDNIPTQYERVEFLSGMPSNPDDPSTIGLTFEPVKDDGIYFGDSAGTKDIVGADDVVAQPVINLPVDGATDNISDQIQDFRTNEHDQLMTFRASFPSATVKQAPAFARSIVLAQIGAAGDFRGELNLPNEAVTARITWTLANTVDLWAAFGSDATIPSATTQPTGGGGVTMSTAANDGTVLNPDSRVDYLVKGKRAISFRASAACTVNVQCYLQA